MKKIMVVLVALVVMLSVTPVFAQDDFVPVVEGCTDPKAVNYLYPPDWEGWKIVSDGSCEYLYCEVVYVAEDGYEVVSCDNGTPQNGNYNDYFMDWSINQNLVPDETAYFEMIDIEGCTDPEALNWMDPQWWEGFNIIEDGSCYFEDVIEPLNSI